MSFVDLRFSLVSLVDLSFLGGLIGEATLQYDKQVKPWQLTAHDSSEQEHTSTMHTIKVTSNCQKLQQQNTAAKRTYDNWQNQTFLS